jgi:DNA polymerase-3 subunit delta'
VNPPWVDAAWDAWSRRVASGRVPHAILLAGPAGLGKRALAADIAGGLLCAAPQPDGRPCGRCRACALVAAGTHPDLHRITFTINEDTGKLRTEIVVDQVRALRDTLAQTSQFGGWRVALIEPAEGMNTASFNALLKTLEEPEAKALLLLVSDRPGVLPATIRSRCQRIDLRFPPRAEALAWLSSAGVADSVAAESLDLAAGNPGLARSYAEPAVRAQLDGVLRDLAAVAAGRIAPAEVAGLWLKDKDATPGLLSLAAQAVRLAAWSARGQGAPGKAVAALAGLTAGADFPKLAAWWDRMNAVREQLRAPLRHDLLLLELLRDFRAIVQLPRQAKG